MDNEQKFLRFIKPFKIIAFITMIILLSAKAMHKPMLSALCFIVLGIVGFICSVYFFVAMKGVVTDDSARTHPKIKRL